IGVATAVATRFSVMTQEISSCVADRLPRICGRTTLASVIVMPNSKVDICTVSRTIHCRSPILNRPDSGGAALAAARTGGDPGCCDSVAARLVSATDKTGYRLEP